MSRETKKAGGVTVIRAQSDDQSGNEKSAKIAIQLLSNDGENGK